MEERYPYIRFVVNMAQGLAAVIAAVVLLGGLVGSCRIGGLAGFLEFIICVVVAGVTYVGAMVWVESMRVFLDIEENTRQLVVQARERSAPPPAA